MEIRQLQYFVEVAHRRSFSRAAVTLGVAQPALSRQVQQLEAELTLPLFTRNGRGVSLTPAGELMLSRASDILAAVSAAARDVAALSGTPRGTAVIGVPPTVGRVLTLPLVYRLKARFPQVSVKIVEGFSGHIVEWLANGRIDVGLFYDDPLTHRFVLEPLVREPLYLIGPSDAARRFAGCTVSADELFDLPMILPSSAHGLRLYLDDVAVRLKRSLRVELEVDALFSMLRAVRDGMGFTILPRAAVLGEAGADALAAWRVVDPELVRTLSMSTHANRPEAIPTKTICAVVREEVKARVACGQWASVAGDPAASG